MILHQHEFIIVAFHFKIIFADTVQPSESK